MYSNRKISSIILAFLLLVSTAIANNLDYKLGELIFRFAPKATGEQLTKNEKQTLLTSLDAMASLRARPERLTARTDKFYAITSTNTISALLKQEEIKEVNIKQMLERLDEMWLDGDLDEHMTEDEYLEFRKAVEDLLQ